MNSTTRRWLGLAAASVAVLAAVAVIGPLVFRNDASAPASSVPAQTVPTSVDATPTLPSSDPDGSATLPQPTPVTPQGSITASATPSPTATPLPTEPGMYARFETVGDVVVASDAAGLWTRKGPNDTWTLTPLLYPASRSWCRTTVGDQIAFVHNNADEERAIAWFSPALPGWLTHRAQTLPPFPDADVTPGREDYCQAIVMERRLVLAATNENALIFAIEQADGSFRGRTVSYPHDEWLRGESPSFLEARTLRHGDAIVIAHCSYYTDTGCLSTYFRFDASVVGSDAPPEMTWDEAGGSVILPSGNSDVTIYADLGGSINRGFNLMQVGDETWAVELTEELGSSRGPDFSTPVGVWSASPLGTSPAVLGPGYWPRFAMDGDTVLAAMTPLGESGPGVHWTTPATEQEIADAAATQEQWWSFDRAAHRWQSLDGDPTAPATPPPELPPAPIGPPLRWTSNEQGDQNGVHIPDDTRTWDDVVGNNSPFIVGDRAFARDDYLLWESNDRGVSWSATEVLPWSPGRDFCAATTDDGFAHVSTNAGVAIVLTIKSEGGTEHLEWPAGPRVYIGDRGFRPCRPLRMNDQWWLGEVDHDHRTLRIISTADGERFDTHLIDLGGLWQEALPGGSTWGTVHLYHDDDWVVARLCRSGDGSVCSQTVDVRLNGALFDDGPAADGVMYRPADLAMDPPTVGSARTHVLHQVGDELWSVEINTVEGTTYAYGGDARVGRYGGPLERVDGAWVDVRLRYGQVMRCIYDYAYFTEPPTTCETLLPDGSWQPVLGTIAVDWATVPTGTPVSFFYRTADGRVMVVPS